MDLGFNNLLINGFLTCLYIQLFIVGLFNFINGTKRNVILGVVCCVLSLSFIYSIYWERFNESLVYNILFGGYKHMFLPTLVYLYVAMISENIGQRRFFLLFLAPLVVHIGYLVVKFRFEHFYTSYIDSIVLTMNMFILLLHIFFLLFGFEALHRLKPIILKRNFLRFKFFFLGLLGYGIFLSLNSVTPYFFGETSFERSFEYLSKNFFIALATLVNLSILIFAIIESPSLKQFVVSKNIYKPKKKNIDNVLIEDFIMKYFVFEKQFKNPDFNLDSALNDFGIKSVDFRTYLKTKKGISVVEFINGYRIEAFKALLTEVDLNKYSLMGLANQVGYTSKATFYRNFKAQVGITPKEFIENKFKI